MPAPSKRSNDRRVVKITDLAARDQKRDGRAVRRRRCRTRSRSSMPSRFATPMRRARPASVGGKVEAQPFNSRWSTRSSSTCGLRRHGNIDRRLGRQGRARPQSRRRQSRGRLTRRRSNQGRGALRRVPATIERPRLSSENRAARGLRIGMTLDDTAAAAVRRGFPARASVRRSLSI